MLRSLLSTVLGLIWIAVLVLVGSRFLALLFDANPNSEIVERLMRHSDFWVKPFFGMFDLANKSVETGGAFEPASLIAFIFWFLAGSVVLSALSGPWGGGWVSRHSPV